MPDMKDYLQVNNTRLFYSLKGEGEPLVFLHGVPFNDHRIWDCQADAFANKYKVVCYDHRGYGESDVPVSSFSYFDDLKSLIEALELKKVSLIGSSFGGGVAIDFALKYPELLKSLILVCPALNGYPYPPEFMTEIINLYTTAFSQGPETAIEKSIVNPFWEYFFPAPEKKEARAKVLQITREAKKCFSWDPRLAAVLEPYASGRLKEIRIPALIILGDKDSNFNIAAGEYIHKNIENSIKVVIPGCGHLPHVEEPAEFNRVALDFLEEAICD